MMGHRDKIKSRAPLLTLTMIVKDGAEYLAGCLDSVKTIVDELVIVDTGSSDASCEIAEQYGAQLFSYPWNDSFADARNESLHHASGQWILYLDADERIAPESRSQLRQLLLDPAAMAYDVKIRSRLKDSIHWGEFPRLFRNHPFIKFEGRIHEQVLPAMKRLHWQVTPSQIVIDHLGYAGGDDKMNAKLTRNERLLHMQIKDCPTDAFAHYCLGNVYEQMQQRTQAIHFYQASVELDNSQPKTYYLLGNQLLEIAQYNQAEQCYERAHELAPDVNEVLYNLAISQIKQSRYDVAIANLRKLQQRQPNDERIQKYLNVCRQMITYQKELHA